MNNKDNITLVLDFLRGKEAVNVSDIIKDCGAEQLSVYPILFKLEQEGIVKVLEREQFGAAKLVALNKEID